MSGQPGYAPPPDQMQEYGYAENGGASGFDFDDASIRRGFIRKVYAILMTQLSITMAFIAWFIFHRPTQLWALQNRWVALAVVIAMILILGCVTEIRRKAPLNFIFLLIFTIAQSFLLAVSASIYDVKEVLMAVGITAAVCLGLTLFAFQTKWDFTVMGGALVAMTMVLLVFGLIAIFIPRNNIVTLVYAALGAFIFSLYLVYDTQLMMGGKHSYSISPEEYIFAALNLYLDIVQIFQYILIILGNSR
ncbi:inhibitor of apoptosis-promoting bax1 domain-containing protein [Phthorimaea operculella]|nr:inhibitor of apoptosis-promoting bax1 domain-containing protein [Phthorimaea operculella]